ncbi:UNVERIFIED_CONTAM: hypothetical protein Slati_3685200 [Sesamum latifolium]|uniref:DUF4218 domain-containing protein n=1 Tax=Sesamum latifolium TaxID=2727402 RepID=A0AAW2U397_9LAMI
MQKLILIAFGEMLPQLVWSALTELNIPFQILCLTILNVNKVQELEASVTTILCNFEKIFLPALFESIEHLIVHLPYEASRSSLNDLYEHHHLENPIIEKLLATQFKDWFKRRVKSELNYKDNELLKLHYCGPTAEVTTFSCYFVNDYNFHTKHHCVGKSAMNCGVDPVRGMKVHPRYHLVDINFKKVYQKNEPFILTQQAIQVYYTEYPSMKSDKVDWMAVCKIKARRVIDDSRWKEVAFQEEETIPTPQVVMDNHSYDLHDPNGIQLVVELSIAN